MNLNDLKQPFLPNDIEFRAGATKGDDNNLKALALPYITSRAVMDRLDDVLGPQNWKDLFKSGPDGGVVCGISIRVENEWITKWDGADNTNFEAVKGGLSDAFKRAAVKWGIGRFLYDMPKVWVKAKRYGKTVVIDENEARTKMFGKGQPSQSQTNIDNAPTPTPQPTNGKKDKRPRPMSPDEIKAIITLPKYAKFTSTANDKQRTYAVASLTKAGMSDDRRHQFGLWAFEKGSSKEWTNGECKFVIDWIGAKEENEYTPDPDATKEVTLLLELFDAQQEQIPVEDEMPF